MQRFSSLQSISYFKAFFITITLITFLYTNLSAHAAEKKEQASEGSNSSIDGIMSWSLSSESASSSNSSADKDCEGAEDGVSCGPGPDGCDGACCKGACIFASPNSECQDGCCLETFLSCNIDPPTLICFKYKPKPAGTNCGESGKCDEEGGCSCPGNTLECDSGVCCTENQACCAHGSLTDTNTCEGCPAGTTLCDVCTSPQEVENALPYHIIPVGNVCCAADQVCATYKGAGYCISPTPAPTPTRGKSNYPPIIEFRTVAPKG